MSYVVKRILLILLSSLFFRRLMIGLNAVCGDLKKSSSGRIVNAEESNVYYPWIAHLRRFNAKSHDDDDDIGNSNDYSDTTTDSTTTDDSTPTTTMYKLNLTPCVGAIISKKTILTAAHCICDFVDHDRKKESLHYCDFNDHSGNKVIPANQQILYSDESDDDTEKDLYEKYAEGTNIYINDFNEILVYAGSSDLKNAKKADADRAYVIDTLEIEDDESSSSDDEENDQYPSLTSESYDIGMIIMKEDFDDKKIPNFSPICLPKKDEASTNYPLEVEAAGWGMLYSEKLHPIDQEGNLGTVSSCMTSETGPLESRFSPCNMDQLKDLKSCKKTPPPNVDIDENKNRWEEIRSYAESNIEINPQLDQLHDRLSGQTFYNPNKLADNGWCEIMGVHAQSGQWGICSPSCKEYYDLEDLVDEKEEFWWMGVREKLIHRQGRYILYDSSNVDCANAGTFKPDGELKAGEVCVKTVLPRTKIGYFSGFTQRPIKVDFIEQIYETRESNPFMDSSYIGLCQGDSGAPLWKGMSDEPQPSTSTGESKQKMSKLMTKYTVYAIFTNNFEPCGLSSSFAVTLEDDTVLDWIMEYMEK